MENQFRFSTAIIAWLVFAFAGAAIVAWVFPPAFWLCGVGITLVVIAVLLGNSRTDTHYTWEGSYNFTWFEGLSGLSGVALTIPPLVVAAVKGLTK
jgi:hypothetical protein